MSQTQCVINCLPAANDPTFEPPDNHPPTAPSPDPAVAVWANDFDAWLETPDGLEWLSQQEERLHADYYYGYRF